MKTCAHSIHSFIATNNRLSKAESNFTCSRPLRINTSVRKDSYLFQWSNWVCQNQCIRLFADQVFQRVHQIQSLWIFGSDFEHLWNTENSSFPHIRILIIQGSLQRFNQILVQFRHSERAHCSHSQSANDGIGFVGRIFTEQVDWHYSIIGSHSGVVNNVQVNLR